VGTPGTAEGSGSEHSAAGGSDTVWWTDETGKRFKVPVNIDGTPDKRTKIGSQYLRNLGDAVGRNINLLR